MTQSPKLPVEEILPSLLKSIAADDCILSAPPGAGKSTVLPLKLLELPAFEGKVILLLQPRQVAVRAIAHYLASQVNEKVGRRIGYQMRGESAISEHTRLCVITEGVLITKLQSDPELTDTALVIFDEFHERSLFSDIALGLCVEVKNAFRENLRLLVMSATLNTADLKTLLPDAKVLSCEGRAFPIEYIYRPVAKAAQLASILVSVIEEALQNYSGNILVFLPGIALINKLESALQSRVQQHIYQNVVVHKLHGSLSAKEQQRAIAAAIEQKRKIVLASNIAETSLTIDGLSIVIDSGREKSLKLNIPRKANELKEQLISKASSVQRSGRAGRQQAGVCYRLWSKEQQQYLVEHPPPPITQVDVSQFVLLLLDWGTNFSELPLIDKPSRAQIEFAHELLKRLELIDKVGKLTKNGRQAVSFNTSPRFANMLVNAKSSYMFSHSQQHEQISKQQLVAVLLSILDNKVSGKAFVHKGAGIEEDLFFLVMLFMQKPSQYSSLNKEYRRWASRLQCAVELRPTSFTQNDEEVLLHKCAEILMAAFPDKIAVQNANESYLMVDGTSAAFNQNTVFNVSKPRWIICIDTQVTTQSRATIRRFITIPDSLFSAYKDAHANKQDVQFWDDTLQKVVQKQEKHIGSITLESKAMPLQISPHTHEILLARIKAFGVFAFLEKHQPKAMQLIHRLSCFEQCDTNLYTNPWQALCLSNEQDLSDKLSDYLLPFMSDVSSWSGIINIDYYGIFWSYLSWEQQQFVQKFYPTIFMAPTGNKHKLNYSSTGSAELAIRIQELYGLSEHPSIGVCKHPITLSLLSPAQREVQKTNNLSSFWQGTYRDVQKEMKGKYPKHFWPDKPQNSLPTTRTKKYM